MALIFDTKELFDLVIQRIRVWEESGLDPLSDKLCITDLRKEFGPQVVERAIRHLGGQPIPSASQNPLWDREIDGWRIQMTL